MANEFEVGVASSEASRLDAYEALARLTGTPDLTKQIRLNLYAWQYRRRKLQRNRRYIQRRHYQRGTDCPFIV